jgi:hypothetical protein
MKSKKSIIHYLPEFGCIATAILYAGIGVIAMLSFLKLREGGADESSIMLVLNEFVVGKIIVIAILTGTACYVAWRMYEVFADPYGYGKSGKGLAQRTGIALSTTADALVVWSAMRVLLGLGDIQSNGQPVEERAMTKMLLEAGDAWLVILLGAAIMLTAIVQFTYGITRGYKERMEEDGFGPITRKVFYVLGLYGYGARGIILGIIGFFFLKAGIQSDSDVVVNTDKAFDFIGDNVGHAFFIITALGTIAYGVFMFGMGLTYKPGRD